MITPKKYCIALLSLTISISLVLPFCYHAEMPGHFSHQQEYFSYTFHNYHAHQHNISECSCGHQLRKDFQKPNKVFGGADVLISPAAFFVDCFELPTFEAFLLTLGSSVSFSDGPGPPLYLLHSVFLN